MQRDEYEFRNTHRWICMCGSSNSDKQMICNDCKVSCVEYPKKMNCLNEKCQKVLYDFKKGDICIHCGRKY